MQELHERYKMEVQEMTKDQLREEVLRLRRRVGEPEAETSERKPHWF